MHVHLTAKSLHVVGAGHLLRLAWIGQKTTRLGVLVRHAASGGKQLAIMVEAAQKPTDWVGNEIGQGPPMPQFLALNAISLDIVFDPR